MSRTRASAKAAGATSCAICGSHIETTNDKRTQRKKYCSRECLNEHRRRHSNRNELATEFGVSPGHIKEIVGGRERVNG